MLAWWREGRRRADVGVVERRKEEGDVGVVERRKEEG